MPQLTVTAFIAMYGAVLATITAVLQISAHFRDRSKLRLTMRTDRVAFGHGSERYKGMKLVVITATNVGRRPVTICGFGERPISGRTHHMLLDVHPPRLPCELTEGQSVSVYVDQSQVDFSQVASWYVWDTTDTFHFLHIAPWHKRLLARLRGEMDYPRRKNFEPSALRQEKDRDRSPGPQSGDAVRGPE